MNTLIIMCGIPGSGKSTWIREHIDSFKGMTIKVVSRDTIRFSLVKEDEEYFSKENKVRSIFLKTIKDSVKKNNVTIADATHLNERSRAIILNSLGKSIKDIKVFCVVIDNDLRTAIFQNENREGTRSYVPISAIRRMNSQYVPPSLEEGFDKIYFYNKNETPNYRVLSKE